MGNDTALLEVRLRTLSRDLCVALQDAIDTALAASGRPRVGVLRPVQLTSSLGLDKSLASRIVRSLTLEDELHALHGIPTPQGLALIANAAREAGASAESIERLQHAAEEYRTLLSEFSGGRTDLEATLAGWIPEQRARAERDARRSVFRGMTTMTGTRAGTNYHALYLVPSAIDGRIDSLVVGVRQDLRRLRTGAPLLIASLRSEHGTGGWGARRTTLDGRSLEDDASSILLPDLCSHPIPRLHVDSEADQLLISIAEDALDVNESATLGFGWRTEGHFEVEGGAERPYDFVSVQTVRPIEALVFDLMVHRDVELPETPCVSVASERSVGQLRGRRPPRGKAAGGVVLTDLGEVPSGLASVDVRSCPAIAETACREAGYEVGDFAKYRARIEFPLPTEELTIWWPRRGGE
ncbi:MAG: hypothetical protein AAGB93_06860 [Planctomycetota bacterium]